PVGHPAAVFVDQLARRDPRRRQLDARLLDPTRNREAPQPRAPAAALSAEPVSPALDDVAYPVHGLDVVDQGRTAEETDLRRERRLVAGEPAFPFQALQHRR